MSFYKFIKKLHFMSPLKETNNRSVSNSFFMVFLAALLINLHGRSCAPQSLVVVDSCRQRRKSMGSSCLLEMSGSANARVLSRMKPAGSCADSAGDNDCRIQAASPNLLLLGTESFPLHSSP